MTIETGRGRLLRLRSWYAKLAYVIVAIAIYYLSGYLAPTDNSRGILRSCLVFVLVLLAVRVFRGATETGDEPRPWWRMTGRPPAGFVLCAVTGLVAIALILYTVGVENEPMFRHLLSQEPYVVVTAILFAALAVLYGTSSARLRAIARAERLEEERKKKP
jgi:uncharacterized membrane protein YfcA